MRRAQRMEFKQERRNWEDLIKVVWTSDIQGGADETLRNEWRKGNPGRGKSTGGD